VNLILTSDFPATSSEPVVERIRSTAARPRVAWIPPFTATGREHFPAAQAFFESIGATVERCDIEEELSPGQLARLREYDVVYLTGGDPLGFRRNILRSRLGARLRECLAAGRLVIAASRRRPVPATVGLTTPGPRCRHR
jgi:peptidase E